MNAQILDHPARKKKRKGPQKQYYESKKVKATAVKPEQGVLAAARSVLKDRLEEHPRHGTLLDGSPCDTRRLMREYNRWRLRNGQEQYARNPDWVV